MISRVCETCQLELPLRSLFENLAVAELALRGAQIQAHSMEPRKMTDMLAELESLSDEERNADSPDKVPRQPEIAGAAPGTL
jgi:hypothetical protein